MVWVAPKMTSCKQFGLLIFTFLIFVVSACSDDNQKEQAYLEAMRRQLDQLHSVDHSRDHIVHELVQLSLDSTNELRQKIEQRTQIYIQLGEEINNLKVPSKYSIQHRTYKAAIVKLADVGVKLNALLLTENLEIDDDRIYAVGSAFADADRQLQLIVDTLISDWEPPPLTIIPKLLGAPLAIEIAQGKLLSSLAYFEDGEVKYPPEVEEFLTKCSWTASFSDGIWTVKACDRIFTIDETTILNP